MASEFPSTPANWSYAFAAVAFVIYAIRIALASHSLKPNLLLFAVVASAGWTALTWYAIATHSSSAWFAACILDTARVVLWIAFLLVLTEGRQSPGAAVLNLVKRVRIVFVPIVLAVVALALPQLPPWQVSSVTGLSWNFVALLALAVYGLAKVEQLFRRTPVSRRWAIKPLIIGLAGMFALDLFLYSGGVLSHQVDPAVWAARGGANAAILLFIEVSTRRTTTWTAELHVSREIVFQSTAVLLAGVYLLLMAGGGYWVHFFGGTWGSTLQVAFVFGALLCLAVILLSSTVRARLRVFISKNLFSYRYDYRSEWLRFTRALGASEDGESLFQQAVRALANLVESPGGTLWLKSRGKFVSVANINHAKSVDAEPATGSLASFLARTGWVVCIDDFKMSPANYAGLALPAWLQDDGVAWLIVPLSDGQELIGFVVLSRPLAPINVNWEVRDLLKTAGRQAAISISQIRATEALVESEKFDSFNRMSAFVVHDLKNLVAQLALMLRNAERHQDNPEFRKDMFQTVENAVDRMNQLMQQLRSGTDPVENPHSVDLSTVIQSVIRAKRSALASIEASVQQGIRVRAHADRVERVIGHVVQNAIEASANNGRPIKIVGLNNGEFAVVEVRDSGAGMTEDFVENQLFHAFQTTKPHGMGIGMYESHRYLDTIGGKIDVQSAINDGTTIKIYFPLADAGPVVPAIPRLIA